MNHKRIVGLAGALAMICTSVPVPQISATALSDFEVDDNGIYWQTVNHSDDGEAALDRGENGCFRADWSDVSDVDFGVGTYPAAPANWKNDTLLYEFTSEFALQGDSALGVSGAFDGEDKEFYIIEGWRGARPAVGTKTGEVTMTIAAIPVVYDVYQTEAVVKDSEGKEKTVTQVWSIRQKNTLEEITDGAGYCVNLTEQFAAWETLGIACPSSVSRIGAYVHAGDDATGYVNAIRNCFSQMPAAAFADCGTTPDGRMWEHWHVNHLGTSDMQIHETDGFSANWSNVVEACFREGKDLAKTEFGYDTLSYSYAGKATLADGDQIGIHGTYPLLSGQLAYVWLIDGFAGEKPAAPNVLGSYELDGHTYELSCYPVQQGCIGAPQPVNYLCVRTDGQLTAGAETEVGGTIEMTAHQAQWRKLGFVAAAPTNLSLFAYAYGSTDGSEHTGSADFTKNQLTAAENVVGTAAMNTNTPDGYVQQMTVGGEAVHPEYRNSGSFKADWTNDTTHFDYRLGYEIPEPLDPEENQDLAYYYRGTIDLRDNVYAGVVCDLVDPGMRLYIINSYGMLGVREVENAAYIKSFTVEGVEYDLCKTGDSEYWCVAKTSQTEQTANADLIGHVNVYDILKLIEDEDRPLGKVCALDFYVHSYLANGSIDLITNSTTCRNLYPDQDFTQNHKTADGYVTTNHGEAPYDMVGLSIDGNGVFQADFRNAKTASSSVGKALSKPIDWKACETFDISYQATAEIEGSGWIGVTGIARNKSTTVIFDIVDGWNGYKLCQDKTPVGTIVVGGEKYVVYTDCVTGLCVPMAAPVIYHYWSVRNDNLLSDDAENPMENNVSLIEHFTEWEKLGMNVPDVESAAVMCEIWDYSEKPENNGQFSITKNDTVIRKASAAADQTLKGLFADSFKISGAACITLNPSESAQGVKAANFMKQNYDFAAEYNALTPFTLLKQAPDSEYGFTVELNKNDLNLKFCEENHLPVRIGSLLQPSVPRWFLQDSAGNYLTPDEMDVRLEQMIRMTFAQLAEYYPNLEVFAVDVCADLLDEYGTILGSEGYSEKTNPWACVYGADSTRYIFNAYRYARKYAPKCAALYLKDHSLFLERKVEGFAALAMQLQKEDLIDGIGMEGEIPFYDNCNEILSGFDLGIQKLASIGGLDLQITDLWVNMRQIYRDAERCEHYAELFEILMHNADLISFVTLADYGGMLDGPHWLKDTNLPGYLADHAEIFADAMTVRDPFPIEQYSGESSSEIGAAAKSDVKTVASGDTNCDGVLDVSDAVLAARFVNEDKSAKISDAGVRNTDLNANGSIDTDDITKMLRVIARIEKL